MLPGPLIPDDNAALAHLAGEQIAAFSCNSSRSSIAVKEPLVSKKTSLVLHERVDLGVRQRPDWLSQLVQAKNRIDFRQRSLLILKIVASRPEPSRASSNVSPPTKA
jgi:hypothetical protein